WFLIIPLVSLKLITVYALQYESLSQVAERHIRAVLIPDSAKDIIIYRLVSRADGRFRSRLVSISLPCPTTR
ncbi:hypothetical protein QBC36DRAFT_203946, partial [Triangularia setosa]